MGHEAEKWNVTEKPTCTESGLQNGKCLRCGEEVAQEIEKLDHTIGDWEVSVKATTSEKGTRVKKCKVCKEIVESEEYELTAAEKEDAYKAECEKYSYKEIAREPDKYKGKKAKFKGEVIQVQQVSLFGSISYVLRVNVTKTGSYYTYYTDTIYVTYVVTEDAPRILEEDIITMYGTLKGEKTYTTVLGSSMTIPEFEAKYIDIE